MENLLDRCGRCHKRALYTTFRVKRCTDKGVGKKGRDLGWAIKYRTWIHFLRSCELYEKAIYPDDPQEGLTEK